MLDINYLFHFIRWKLHLISTEEFYRLTPLNTCNELEEKDFNIDSIRDRCVGLTDVSIPIFSSCTSLTDISFPSSFQFMGNVNELPDDSKQGNVYMMNKKLYVNTGDNWEKLQ